MHTHIFLGEVDTPSQSFVSGWFGVLVAIFGICLLFQVRRLTILTFLATIVFGVAASGASIVQTLANAIPNAVVDFFRHVGIVGSGLYWAVVVAITLWTAFVYLRRASDPRNDKSGTLPTIVLLLMVAILAASPWGIEVQQSITGALG